MVDQGDHPPIVFSSTASSAASPTAGTSGVAWFDDVFPAIVESTEFGDTRPAPGIPTVQTPRTGF